MTTEDSENLAMETSKMSNLHNSQEYEQQVFQNAMADKLSHPQTPKPKSCRSPTDDKEYETMRAVALLIRERRRCERLFGDYHPATLQAKMHSATGMCQLGDYEIARELGVEVVAVRQHNLGDDHPETLDAVFNLAISINNQAVALQEAGELGEAEPLSFEAMAMVVKTRGADSLDAACCFSATGSLMSLKGDKAQAIHHYKKALVIRERELGPKAELTQLLMSRLDALLQ
jgi:hypothetical protein